MAVSLSGIFSKILKDVTYDNDDSVHNSHFDDYDNYRINMSDYGMSDHDVDSDTESYFHNIVFDV